MTQPFGEERLRGYVLKRKPDLVRDLLRRTFKRFGLDRELDRYQFVLHWKEIVGEEIAKRAFPSHIRGTSLVVNVSGSAWAQELSFQKQVILRRLKRFVPADSIRDIIFSVEG
jgi:predicted nucleic acid-binding Zn ribbon protein